MKRVMVVGGPGSGKSTFARQLADRTGLPVVHMDHIHWKPGWQERSRQEKDSLTHEIHMKEQWIFEGGHSRTYGERIERADTFVWLDVPVGLRLYRVLKRLFTYYGRHRPDLPEGCPERLSWQTVEFLLFIVRTRKSARAKLEKIYTAPPEHLSVFRLKTLSDTNAFLERISAKK